MSESLLRSKTDVYERFRIASEGLTIEINSQTVEALRVDWGSEVVDTLGIGEWEGQAAAAKLSEQADDIEDTALDMCALEEEGEISGVDGQDIYLLELIAICKQAKFRVADRLLSDGRNFND